MPGRPSYPVVAPPASLTSVLSVMATPYGKTTDNLETQFQTNHFSHFLLFHLLLPLLLSPASTPSRVVSVSSMGHRVAPTRPADYNFADPATYNPYVAYGQAKTANIHLANSITRRYAARGLTALSLHPGGVMTGLGVFIPPEEWARYDTPEVKRYVKSAAQGAATSVYAAVGAELEGRGGLYLSNCAVQGPFEGTDPMAMDGEGFAAWAFDEEGEERLWRDSLGMVGWKGRRSRGLMVRVSARGEGSFHSTFISLVRAVSLLSVSYYISAI